MNVSVSSTKAKVRNPQKLAEVLDSYVWEGVKFRLDEEGKLEVVTDKSVRKK